MNDAKGARKLIVSFEWLQKLSCPLSALSISQNLDLHFENLISQLKHCESSPLLLLIIVNVPSDCSHIPL
jgi:hypothetical protein